MPVDGISGTTGTTGAGMSGDLVDISFRVALLQVQTLDQEIGLRLTEMEQLNELREAYTDRIGELRELIGGLRDGRGWVDAATAQRLDFAWDGTSGGPRADADGMLCSGSFQVVDADGSVVTRLEAHALASDRADMLTPVGPEAGEDATGGPAESGGSGSPATFRGYEEAQAVAEACGGKVQIQVLQSDVEREIERLQDQVDNLGADGELGMLGLNRLLSRRTQVLQLTSNIMSSTHQTAMAMIANLKV